MTTSTPVVLSLYPNTDGFGYVCIEWPQKLLDSGIASLRPICNGKLIRRVKQFIDFYKPTLIIVRDCDAHPSWKTKRAQQLVADIATDAKQIQLPVYRYSRQQMREVFEQFGARTKYEIAQKLIEWFPELKWRNPKIRKPWMEEDYHMGVFDALALAVTHKYLTE